MYKYDFQTKEITHVFDNLKYVVNNSQLQIKVSKKEAVVVELFNQLFVGIPIELLGNLTIGGWNSESTGYFLIGYEKIYFSIHGEILYLRKRS
jgi:hypothetical protein